jgi:hypothetical protein
VKTPSLHYRAIFGLGVGVIALLMAIPESRAQSQDQVPPPLFVPQDTVPPPLSVPKAQFFENNPAAWNQFLSQLPRRQAGPPLPTAPRALPSFGGTWQSPCCTSFFPSNPLLLTDGTVIAHAGSTADWYRLTPDITGSYVNGTWSQIASLPVIGGTQYAPLYFASAVLPDGRVIIMGGEYNDNDVVRTNLGAIYDPLANTWTAVTAPASMANIGDAQSAVLANGSFMLGACCNGPTADALFNATTLGWTSTGGPSAGGGYQDEQGYSLLPNGNVLTIDIWTCYYGDCGSTSDNPTNAEQYTPSSGTWSSAGNTPVSLVDPYQCRNWEIGPAALRPDGSLVAFGGNSGCVSGETADPTAIYDSSNGLWSAGPNVPAVCGTGTPPTTSCSLADAPAALLPNGNILFAASAGAGSQPTHFFEFTSATSSSPNTINQVTDTINCASSEPAYAVNFLVLPNGQILATDLCDAPEFYTPTGGPNASWAPVISSAPSAIYAGATYPISGSQFNGLSQGAYFGDDVQGATNYPIVQITNSVTGHVFYARTFNHSTMSIAPSTTGSTNFTVPDNAEIGPSTLVVIANGIPSAPANVWVQHSGYATAPDFTGDGGSLDSDILWRNASGQAEIWLMNGTSISAEDSLGVVNNGWRIVGTGDFNGDGNTDILWRNISGAVEIWMMNGSAVTSAVNLGVTSNAWTIVGTGDFTGSGNDDILWRNANGEVYIWFMNGTAISSTANLGVVSNAWTIVGVGDFNTDGKADILWRNTSGAVEIWLMNGSKVLSETNLGVASTAWTVDATADFNGTGFTRDILWRNSNGNVDIWFMGPGTAANSVKIDSTASLGAVSNAWTIVGTGKFTGADSDILWRNANGTVDIWSMSGAAISSTKNLGVVPLSWTVIQ